MRSNLASLCIAVAASSLGLLTAWSQQALNAAQNAGELLTVSRVQMQHSDDLVAQLCARGADKALCAEAGLLNPGIRYVMTGRSGVTRWPQYAEPAR